MRKTKLFIAALAYSIALLAITAVLPVQTQPQPTSASQVASFDHSDCQYPDRWSNPVDGCDNSDPAVPECIKAFNTKESEEACIAAFVKQHEQTAQPQPVKTKPETPQTNQCGGK